MADSQATPQVKKQPYWLVYFGLLLAGLLMLAEAAHYYPMQKISAKLSVGLLYSALALFVGNGRPAGYIAAAIIWAAIVISFLIR
jgi:hypothetical protein